ncbi:MAG: hypothetical protein WAV16_02785 [Candidatus Moraniibacteriota bacterium]
MSIFIELLLFFLSFIFLLILPGYFLLLAIFRKKTNHLFLPIEIAVLSFALSLIVFDFLIILSGKLGLLINQKLILILFSLFIISLYALYKFLVRKNPLQPKKSLPKIIFTRSQTILIVLILFLTIFIKTAYLKDAIFPTATDLGHHMYWSKLTAQTGKIPDYQKIEIVKQDNEYRLESNSIADFIIGEHLIFSGINLLSKIPFNSYFPALILFAINIFSILAIFILTLRIFADTFYEKIINSTNLAILSLLIIGPIYAITSPQAKFVSGGVIGNLIGNLLIPLCLYLFYRALKEKNSWFLFLGLFLSAGLFYTHHLSGFIFLFILAFIFLTFNGLLILQKIFNASSNKIPTLWQTYQKVFKDLMSIFIRPQIILFFIGAILFLFLVYTPSYLSPSATSTAVGAPSKSTRAGLTLEQFKYAVGELRLALGIIGIFVLMIVGVIKSWEIKDDYRKLLPATILIGWALCLFFMTVFPHYLHINLPSERVSNYANFPFIILSSLGLIYLIVSLQKIENNFNISKNITRLGFIAIFTTIIFAGYYDNSGSLSDGQKSQRALQTFHLSKFLAEQIALRPEANEENFLKDHNYITADSWIKLFFLKDYNYPLSRGYFKRYEDPTKPREMCTLWMISEPSSERAQSCYLATKTHYIAVDTSVDGPQFESNPQFSKIYEGPSLSIFYKK